MGSQGVYFDARSIMSVPIGRFRLCNSIVDAAFTSLTRCCGQWRQEKFVRDRIQREAEEAAAVAMAANEKMMKLGKFPTKRVYLLY